MKKLSIEEKLDLILDTIKTHYLDLPNDDNWKKICRLVTDGNGINTGNPDYKHDPRLLGYLRGLEKEGFIELFNNIKSNPPEEYYVATVKGLIFEGFVNRDENKKKDRRIENTWKLAWIFVGAMMAFLFTNAQKVLDKALLPHQEINTQCLELVIKNDTVYFQQKK